MIGLFLTHIVAPLVQGQDPYAILGVESKADNKTLRSAYMKKVRQYHPDINHDPGSQKKFEQVQDAYDLLIDPVSRERYDKTKKISDVYLTTDPNVQRRDKVKTILDADHSARAQVAPGEFDMRKKIEVIVDLNDGNFDKRTSDGRPWIVCFYQNEWEYNQKKQLFDDLYERTGLLFGLGRINANYNQKTASKFDLKQSIQLVFIDRSINKTSYYQGTFTLKDLTRFAARKFGAQVTIVHSDEDVVKWRKQNLDRVHVIQFSALSDVPTTYEMVSAFMKQSAVFAFASISQKNRANYPRSIGSLSLDDLPTYTIYRMATPRDDTMGGEINPMVAPMDLDMGQLTAIIRHFNYPCFPDINQANVARLCKEYCIVFVKGVPMAKDIKAGINEMNLPTGSLNLTVEPRYGEELGIVPGDFVILKPKTNEYQVWKDITTWGDFRKKLEFMNHGIAKFKKHTGPFPNLTNPFREDPFKAKMDQMKKKWKAFVMKIQDVYTAMAMWMGRQNTIVILGIFGVVLFLIVDVMTKQCCNEDTQLPLKEKEE